MTFNDYEQAEAFYYKHHQCDSDDPDIETAKIERWIEEEGHIIKEDNPDYNA